MTTEAPFAVLFDMDGVLVDNMSFHVDAWRAFCERHGFPFELTDYNQNMNGRNAFDSLTYLMGRPPSDEELISLTAEKEAIYREQYAPHLQPARGLLRLLNDLRYHDVRLAVATSAPLENVSFTLDGTGLRPYFDAVIDASAVTRGKPAPDIYLAAATAVGVPPEQCIVVEDALLGIQAGRAAGMKVIGVTTTHEAGELRHTDRVVRDFEELNFESFRELIRSTEDKNSLSS
jgi:beta-phosphoglucomutase family hydrolase